ncbi:MAG: HAD-IIIA family hydrolase [Eggerthella sp.]|nr:HAD-IIIA family hydrolase [Eggerthella sp.]
MQAVIMAGGKGTRLRAVTGDDVPKPMASLAGLPILEWQVKALVSNGVTQLVIVVGYLGETIMEYFGDGRKWNASIVYITEKEPLGTAGSFPLIKGLIEEDFLLVFGDIFFDIDIKRFYAFHKEKRSTVTLLAHPNDHPYDSDLLDLDEDGRVLSIRRKNEVRVDFYVNCVNAGLYILNSEALGLVTEVQKTDLEQEVLPKLTSIGRVFAYASTEYVKDAGTPERFSRIENDVLSGIVFRRNRRRLQKCIFLDRDGTINELDGFVSDPNSIRLIPGAAQAIRRINSSDWLCVVVTNQPVIARGECTFKQMDRIHARLSALLGEEGAYFDALYYCPHHPDKGFEGEVSELKLECDCRKPNSGMLERAAADLGIDLKASWLIGDSTADVETGVRAGLRTILVETGEAGRDGKYEARPYGRAADLLGAVSQILDAKERRMDYRKALKRYYEEEVAIIKSLDVDAVNRVLNMFEEAREAKSRIYIFGNGGSAATASHFCCDFNKGVSSVKNPAYRFECLSDNVPTMMAVANDLSYEEVFSFSLSKRIEPGDIVVGISGSGNSQNVVNALNVGRKMGARTGGFVGYDGGVIKELVDECVHIPISNMQIVEDLHMILDHSMMFVLANEAGR